MHFSEAGLTYSVYTSLLWWGGPLPLDLGLIVRDFAAGFSEADARRPVFVSRTGRAYQPGLGPHGEDRAMALVLAEMQGAHPDRYQPAGQGLSYPGSRQKCDLWIGNPAEWAIEVKMARFFGDNGKLDDTSIKDVLSPFEVHRSALTDTSKLAASRIAPHKALVIYGFDYTSMPLVIAIEAFEVLAGRLVQLGPRQVSELPKLVHSVHSRGAVFGWEVADLVSKACPSNG